MRTKPPYTNYKLNPRVDKDKATLVVSLGLRTAR